MRSPIAKAEPKEVFHGKDGVYQPAWLPDGRGLITHDLDNVYWVALDGKVTRTMSVHELAPEAGGSSADRYVVCPTDANRLVYSVEEGEDASALWLYDLATKKRTRLTPTGVFAMDPNWSRDGRFVYFRGFTQERQGAAPRRHPAHRHRRHGWRVVRVAPVQRKKPQKIRIRVF